MSSRPYDQAGLFADGRPDDSGLPSLQVFLLDRIGFDVCLQLQQQLVPAAAARDDGQATVLLAEHPPAITVGRGGSADEVALGHPLIRQGQVAVRWTNRGGGAWLHCPGQLGVYCLTPLGHRRWTPGAYLRRLMAAMIETLDELNVVADSHGRLDGLWGRSGQLAAVGLAFRHGVSYYGLWLNVNPPMGLFRLLPRGNGELERIGCLVAERRGPVRMPTVRSTLIAHLAEALGCDRYHLHTGHPLLRRLPSPLAGNETPG